MLDDARDRDRHHKFDEINNQHPTPCGMNAKLVRMDARTALIMQVKCRKTLKMSRVKVEG
jgi:hypothetical protein